MSDRELGWDDPIENDGPDFETLPEGDYDFEVVGFERGRHPGSEKLPPCNKATLSIKIKGAAGQTTIKHNLFLHTKTEGLLCAFFMGIGQRKHGEKLTMNWGRVVGSTGRCKIGVRKWTKENGEEVTGNEIKKFYDPAESKPSFEKGKF
ncbi:MAG: phage protein [Peptococcaceae bacterium BICA1-7]|nr:MAG: phage protein [Peptococcaceae bacterium BICA1-7]HBV97748.1 DUF669 domain-containing protein [Desulfotomaculum sp.]